MTTLAEPLPKAARHPPAELGRPGLVWVYVWDRVVRVAHWAIVLSMLALIPTGLYIAHPFDAQPAARAAKLTMANVKVIHFYAATVFTAATVARLAWLVAGSRWARWDQLLPVTRYRLRKLGEALKFYALYFTRPAVVIGHNPLAGLSYVFAFFLYASLVVTGLALYSLDSGVASPLHPFHFLVYWLGGADWVRVEHHVAMWLLVAFAVFHIYAGALTSLVEKTGELDSMFSGYKFFPPEEVGEDYERGTNK